MKNSLNTFEILLNKADKNKLEELLENYKESKRLFKTLIIKETNDAIESAFYIKCGGRIIAIEKLNDSVKISEMLRYISKDLDEYGEKSAFY